jgi:hypothetical protein
LEVALSGNSWLLVARPASRSVVSCHWMRV